MIVFIKPGEPVQNNIIEQKRPRHSFHNRSNLMSTNDGSITFQLILTVALMAYVIRRARREFNKIMEEMETASSGKSDEEKGSKDALKENGVYQNGTVTRHLSKVDLINENVIKDKTPS